MRFSVTRKSVRWTAPVVLALAAAGTPVLMGVTGHEHASNAAASLSSGQGRASDASADQASVDRASTTGSTSVNASAVDLTNARKKDIAMQVVSSAENSSLDWKAQYRYIEDIGDGRGYTAGIIGFCSGTGDMLDLVEHYTDMKKNNVLEKYLPALKKDDGGDSHSGLGSDFAADWKKAAGDRTFQQAQNDERDRVYFNPAVRQAKKDGLRALGQFIYYDAIVMHGPGDDGDSFGGIRRNAMRKAKTPAQGGNETTYLNAFLDARKVAMNHEEAHSDTGRVDTEQRVFLRAGNFNFNPPLNWKVYGDSYSIKR